MKFTDKVVMTVVGIEVDLYQAYARVMHETDVEALHDFRVGLRRLRSLLNPLGVKDACAELSAAAAQAVRLTNPIRDMEVMAAELEAHGLLGAARARRKAVSQSYRGLNNDPVVDYLFEALSEWPATFRHALMKVPSERLKVQTGNRIKKQLIRLTYAMNDPCLDRHKIRLLVKRARYSLESFPKLFPVPSTLMSSLKQLQGALGDWHDRQQWCLKAQHEADLRPLVAEWLEGEASALATAEEAITSLATQLSEFLVKKNAV